MKDRNLINHYKLLAQNYNKEFNSAGTSVLNDRSTNTAVKQLNGFIASSASNGSVRRNQKAALDRASSIEFKEDLEKLTKKYER